MRAAARNRLQTSLNLGIGSAIACIGLTIPTVALLSIVIGMPLELGIPAKEAVLLVLTFVVAVLTLGSGRATVMQGAVHLVLFIGVYLSCVFSVTCSSCGKWFTRGTLSCCISCRWPNENGVTCSRSQT